MGSANGTSDCRLPCGPGLHETASTSGPLVLPRWRMEVSPTRGIRFRNLRCKNPCLFSCYSEDQIFPRFIIRSLSTLHAILTYSTAFAWTETSRRSKRCRRSPQSCSSADRLWSHADLRSFYNLYRRRSNVCSIFESRSFLTLSYCEVVANTTFGVSGALRPVRSTGKLSWIEYLCTQLVCLEMPSLRSHFVGPATQSLSHDVSMAPPQRKPTKVAQTSHSHGVSSPPTVPDSEAAFAAFARHDGTCTRLAGNRPPAANITPPEILLQIYSMLNSHDFDNARRTCSQWMHVSLTRDLLEGKLKRAGWWDASLQDCEEHRIRRRPSREESDVWRMSKRFATECLLSGRKANVERPGFMVSEIVDCSGLAQGGSSTRRSGSLSSRDKSSQSVSTFSASSCSKYLLITTGRMIHVFRLFGRKGSAVSSSRFGDTSMIRISNIECPSEVLSATLDTSGPGLLVAALMCDRVGMVCDLGDPEQLVDEVGLESSVPVSTSSESPTSVSRRPSPHYYYNLCTEDHPPRTIALCPGRRCVAFGCAGGIEVHWVDENTHQDQRRHFPMSQPSEVLHFLPNSSNAPLGLRLISSLAGPGSHECSCRQSPFPGHSQKCQFHLPSNVHSSTSRRSSSTSNFSLVRATHCHHYRAIPINDGFHIIFIEPRTGLLCIGSDAPIGGPTSLTRAFVCIPPYGKDSPDSSKEARMPTAFAVGSDLRWGLRVVAAYQDRIVLYTIPLDVFNAIRKERERQGEGVMGDSDLARDWFVDSERSRKRRESLVQNQNGDWEFLFSVSYRPTAMMWPFKIYGKEIGCVEGLVELAVQSENGSARVWAFDGAGRVRIFDVESSGVGAVNGPRRACKVVNIDSNGSFQSSRLVDPTELVTSPLEPSRKRKASELCDGFVGRYGLTRFVPGVDMDVVEPATAAPNARQHDDSSIRRPSFAACIVDFKIPELGSRDGPWRNHRRAS